MRRSLRRFGSVPGIDTAKVLKTYRICVVLIFIMIVLGGWFVIDLVHGGNAILADRATTALQMSKIIGQSFTAFLNSSNYVLSDILGHISEDDLVFPDKDPEHAARIQSLFKKKLATVPVLRGIGLYDKNCVMTARSNGERIGHKMDVCQCEQGAYDDQLHVQYWDAEISPSKRPIIILRRNLTSRDGNIIGGIAAGIDLGFIQEWLSTYDIEEGGSLTILDQSGMLFARVPATPEEIGQKHNDPVFQHIHNANLSHTTLTATSPIDSKNRIYALSKTEGFPFYVVVGLDESSALRDWWRRAFQIAAGFASLSLFLFFLVRSHFKVIKQREVMHRLATIDELTGIANRRSFFDAGNIEVKRAHRYEQPLSILMLDIDHFKLINDAWGHPVGDTVLKNLSRTLVQSLRGQDLVGRIGGEEFAVILPETDASQAKVVAETLRNVIEQFRSDLPNCTAGVKFTVSIGVASRLGDDDSLDALMGRADRALYQAKQAGRNRVVSSPPAD